MANTQEFVTVIRLNDTEAKNNLEALKKKVDALKKSKEDALAAGEDTKLIKNISKDLKAAEAELKAYKSNVSDTIDVLNNLSTSSAEEIKKTMRALKKEQDKTTDPEAYAQLEEHIEKCRNRMEELKSAIGLSADEAEKLMQSIESLSQNKLNDLSSYYTKQMAALDPTSSDYSKANGNLQQVMARLQEIAEGQRVVNTIVDQYNKELDNAGQEMRKVSTTAELIDRTMGNLSGANVRDLQYAAKILNEELKNTDRGTEAYNRLNEQLKQVKDTLKDVGEESKESESWWDRLADASNKYFGVIAQGAAALTGLTLTIREAVQSYSDMEEAMANTSKYTGQSAEELERMNEDFKKMDTRSSREQLNELAGAAGRLGITSTEAIEEFVDAADKIGVALGDDLGDGAVDKIGKLAMAFGEDERLGLRGAMLATGSAINNLAQNSAANAGYLVEFTARVAGVGKQLGMTQADIMGFGATLDENMQKDEMAATAFSQLLTKMATDTKTFAKMAGMSVEDFSKLIKEDANNAVLTLMDTLRKQEGGFETLGKMFGDMGLDGTRALSVMTTIADKIDDVRKHQQTANEAYREGVSVIEEFDVQNNTVQAGIDKAKKAFNEITVELGEKLLPVAKLGISTTSLGVKALATLVNIVTEYWRTLVTLAAGLVAYEAVLNAATFKEVALTAAKKVNIALSAAHRALVVAETAAISALNGVYALLTGRMTLATAAQKLLNKAVLTNPYVAAATAMVAMIGVLGRFASKADEATKAQQLLNEANKQAAAECRSEIAEVSALVETAKNKALADDTRRAAIEELQKKYPEYLKNLSLENINSTSTRKAIDNLTDSILAQAKARVYLAKIEEMQRKQMEIEEEYVNSWWGKFTHTFAAQWKATVNTVVRDAERVSNTVSSLLNNGTFNGWNYDTWIDKNGYSTTVVGNYVNTMKADIQEYKDYEKQYLTEYIKIQQEEAKRIAEARKAAQAEVDGTASGASTPYKSEAEIKKEAIEKKKQEAEARKKAAQAKRDVKEAVASQKAISQAEQAENMRAYSAGEKTYQEYLDSKQQIALAGLDAQIQIYGKDSDEAKKLYAEKQRLYMQYSEKVLQQSEKEIRQQQTMQEYLLRKEYEDKSTFMYHNDFALQEALYQNERDALMKRRDLYAQNSENWLDLNDQLRELDLSHQLDREQQNADLLSQYRQQWIERDVAEEQRIAMLGLERLHSEGLISEEEYQKMLKAIRDKYALEAAQQAVETSAQATTQRNADTAYQTAKNSALAQMGNKNDNSLGSYMMSDVELYKTTMEKLREMYGEDADNYQEFQLAKQQATQELAEGISSKMQMMFSQISSLMSGFSSYVSAQSTYEQNVVTAKYDKEIEAAGGNSKKAKKLEEQKQKELAKIKSKYNKQAMVIEIAQAMASTALAAINAYSSAAKEHWLLGPVAAGMATAAGMMQIAAIKKQHEAEEAGYYDGGFTGGNRYRREAGVVHEGEFVANHEAVNNRNILPALDLIDQAQRNNTVASLTADDISRSVGGSAATVVSAPTVNVSTDNSEVIATMGEMRETIDYLNYRLENLTAIVAIDGPNGFAKQWKKWQRMQNNR